MKSKERAQKFHDAALLRSGKCSWLVDNLLHPIRRTTQIWVVTHHQCGGCFLKLKEFMSSKQHCTLFLKYRNFRENTMAWATPLQLTWYGDVHCLHCIATFVADLTSVFPSLTPTNISELYQTSICALSTANLHPGNKGWRDTSCHAGQS